MYGPGVPILFPISLLCLISLYLYEKKMITRQTRLPRNFNPKMNDQIVSTCFYGPILYSAIGFWMYTNPAIIGNHIKPIDTIKSSVDTQHKLWRSITEVSPGTPFLILFVISVVAKLDHHFKLYKYCFKGTKLFQLNKQMKDENHKIEPDFYDALAKKHRMFLIEKEEELENHFGISRLTVEQEDKFKNASPAEKSVFRLAIYDMLYN